MDLDLNKSNKAKASLLETNRIRGRSPTTTRSTTEDLMVKHTNELSNQGTQMTLPENSMTFSKRRSVPSRNNKPSKTSMSSTPISKSSTKISDETRPPKPTSSRIGSLPLRTLFKISTTTSVDSRRTSLWLAGAYSSCSFSS